MDEMDMADLADATDGAGKTSNKLSFFLFCETFLSELFFVLVTQSFKSQTFLTSQTKI